MNIKITNFLIAICLIMIPMSNAKEIINISINSKGIVHHKVITSASNDYQKGYEYHYGINRFQNHSKAIKWYKIAAKKGHAKAMNQLGLMYKKGSGVQKNYKKAVYWFKKSSYQYLPSAMNNLGYMYETGKGTSKNYINAVKWYKKAANANHAKAQYNLARMYQYGMGVKKSKHKAIHWYQKSQSNGYKPATFALKNLKNTPKRKNNGGLLIRLGDHKNSLSIHQYKKGKSNKNRIKLFFNIG